MTAPVDRTAEGGSDKVGALPEGAPSSPADAAAKRIFLLLVIATVTWALYTIIDGVSGRRVGFWVNGAVALGSGALTLLVRDRPDRVVVCAHATVALSSAGIVGISLFTGQTRSPVLWFLACAPLFIGYLRGLRATLLWSAVCVAAVVGVEASRQLAPITPEYTVEGVDFASRVVSMIAVVGAFALATGRVHAEQVTRLKESRDTIQELLKQAQRRAEELAVARDAALDASRAKGDFLAVMSHEIRTPLNAVLGLAGVLLDAPLPREQREIVRMIRTSGDTLLALLNDVLDFSKIEAGRMTLEQAPFDLVECVEDALDLFATAAAEKGLDLYYHAGRGVPPRIEGDATRVRQILVNLISNAVKFTPRGSVEVRVSASAASGEPDSYEIHCAVRDTGIGIPGGKLEDLFNQFSQADASTTRRFGGTGLGLAICRALAEKMGGRVWVETELGRGSTFHLTFRARRISVTGVLIQLSDIQGKVAVVTARAGTRGAVAAQVAALGLGAAPCADLSELDRALHNEEIAVVIADEDFAREGLLEVLAPLEPAPAVALLVSSGRDTEARRRLREQWPDAAAVPIPPRRALLQDVLLSVLRGRELPSLNDSSAPPLGMEMPLRVLVAEDNPVNQKVMQLLLERLGYRADMVGNGLEALEAVRERPYDLVFMDMRMPEMDGIDAARRIRAEVPAHRQPRIVALTANVTTEDRAACQKAGMDDFVGKPVASSELVRAITGGQRRRSSRKREVAPPEVMLDALRSLTEGNDEMFEQIVDGYLAISDKLMSDMRSAIGGADLGAAARAAHSLKGSSAQLGAAAVARAAEALEQAAKAGDGSQAAALLPALIEAQSAAADVLREERKRPR